MYLQPEAPRQRSNRARDPIPSPNPRAHAESGAWPSPHPKPNPQPNPQPNPKQAARMAARGQDDQDPAFAWPAEGSLTGPGASSGHLRRANPNPDPDPNP